MDVSDIYIKMCGHPLIQEQWEPKEGDWGFWKLNGDIDIIDYNDCYYKGENGIEGYIWLPRQDQIQEMCKFVNLDHAISSIYGFYRDRIGEFGDKTLEQLWLAVYLHEKHGLIWDGKKWIKEV